MIRWFKSSYSSGSEGDSCVEVALHWDMAPTPTPATIHIRDSKQSDGPRLHVAPGAWTEFLGYAAGH
ncbi:DUF397 domain-containing protein [Streptomyces sp. IMTB 2501]|uniref:DUF397 domain-containing protein n=1 Tax=Streptomyces sp. IMTB 2501 TaxID=1776340 RepID=UPI00096CAB4D|nr:DUF397 domain-containing protein [Streptomyces sp. IMTB 2501]OLZ71513.1 DUF397 domain-containing protein [Streptomyces sp. IMTB 2501]